MQNEIFIQTLAATYTFPYYLDFICTGGYWIPVISYFIGLVGEKCEFIKVFY